MWRSIMTSQRVVVCDESDGWVALRDTITARVVEQAECGGSGGWRLVVKAIFHFIEIRYTHCWKKVTELSIRIQFYYQVM